MMTKVCKGKRFLKKRCASANTSRRHRDKKMIVSEFFALQDFPTPPPPPLRYALHPDFSCHAGVAAVYTTTFYALHRPLDF